MIANNSYYKDELKELSYTKVEGTSTPRGRIYDRNYKIIVDNKAIKSITYEKEKNVSTSDMIELAYEVSPHLELSYTKLTDRAKREFYLAKYPELCNKKVTKKEKEKVLIKR